MKIESGKSHLLYLLPLYLWSREDYGSNDNPLMLFIPHSACTFQMVLDCVMLAFHHTNIPEFINLMMEARKKYSFERVFGGSDKICEEDELYSHFHDLDQQDSAESLFDIIKSSKNQKPNHADLNSEIIYWAKSYSEEYLKKFDYFPLSLLSQFPPSLNLFFKCRKFIVVFDQMFAKKSNILEDAIPTGSIMGMSFHSENLSSIIEKRQGTGDVVVMRGLLEEEQVAYYRPRSGPTWKTKIRPIMFYKIYFVATINIILILLEALGVSSGVLKKEKNLQK